MKKNKVIPVIILAIIVISIGIYIYNDMSVKNEKRIQDVLNYKGELFKGVICQYSCPLKFQEVQNKTQLLPEAKCVKNCTQNFKKKYPSVNFTKEELNKDNFFKDFEKIVEDCQVESKDPTATYKVNNTQFFMCANRKLPELKNNYTYLV